MKKDSIDKEWHEMISVVLGDVMLERIRQMELWGEQNHEYSRWLAIIGEEYGELCQAINRTYGWGKETDSDNIYEELIQLAAASIQMAEFIQRIENHLKAVGEKA